MNITKQIKREVECLRLRAIYHAHCRLEDIRRAHPGITLKQAAMAAYASDEHAYYLDVRNRPTVKPRQERNP
jgi:hypothetical protein